MDVKTDRVLNLIGETLESLTYGEAPEELYQPIEYIMSLGGKRLRPMLVLMAYSLYRDDLNRIAKPALAVEVFHNFTLMHDDIMDKAPLRRGMPTVHEKWDEPTAILSGDVMLVRAYDLLLESPPGVLGDAIRCFNKCAAEVCEGQQFDMLFESRGSVPEEEYINMIRLKTAVLLGFSLEFGALLAGASETDRDHLREFGVRAGIGFQLKDDLLDVYGDSDKFGKQVGGDIISNKKTYLLIKALELADKNQRRELDKWLNAKEFNDQEKVKAVRAIYDELGIQELTLKLIDSYFQEAILSLRHVDAPLFKKSALKKFASRLVDRDH